ncbi:MAG: Na+/H+ antiporter NhaA [Gammaproteobacteria bacterium]
MLKHIEKFIDLSSASGLLLIFMLIAALILANSPLSHFYQHFQDLPIQFRVGAVDFHKPLILWVNEGLMAIFFMALALEMKREFCDGELSKPSQLTLPLLGAAGGIIFPIAIFLFFTHHNPEKLIGWPIPSTTDIAFAMGVLSLLGKRVPRSLRVFLVTLSIVDDIAVITIIAIVYSGALSFQLLSLACIGVLCLVILNLLQVQRIAVYMLIGLFIWGCVLKSGVHATLGGIIVGLAIPNRSKKNPEISPLHLLEEKLYPWVAFFILPLFVLLNGGISLYDVTFSQLTSPLTLGIALGLFLGKTFGVFLIVFCVVKLGFAKLPKKAKLYDMLAISALTGIGFTMSLFIGALAYQGTEFENIARLGVLLGSACSALLGCGLFLMKNRLLWKSSK